MVEHLDPNDPLLRNVHLSINHNGPVRVAIVDSDRLLVEGFSSLFSQWDEFELVGHGTLAKDVITIADDARPDVLIVGVCLDDSPSADLIRATLERHPGIGVVALASHGEARLALDAIRAGARGYGSRSELSANRLRSLVWGVACGDVALTGSISGSLREALTHPYANAEKDCNRYFDTLTDRERSILALLTEGKSNSEIGRQLFLSEPTVKKSISSIIDKLHVSNRVQAAVAAARRQDTGEGTTP